MKKVIVILLLFAACKNDDRSIAPVSRINGKHAFLNNTIYIKLP